MPVKFFLSYRVRCILPPPPPPLVLIPLSPRELAIPALSHCLHMLWSRHCSFLAHSAPAPVSELAHSSLNRVSVKSALSLVHFLWHQMSNWTVSNLCPGGQMQMCLLGQSSPLSCRSIDGEIRMLCLWKLWKYLSTGTRRPDWRYFAQTMDCPNFYSRKQSHFRLNRWYFGKSSASKELSTFL